MCCRRGEGGVGGYEESCCDTCNLAILQGFRPCVSVMKLPNDYGSKESTWGKRGKWGKPLPTPSFTPPS